MKGKFSLEILSVDEFDFLDEIFKQELKRIKDNSLPKDYQRKVKFVEFKIRFRQGPYEVLFSQEEIECIIHVLNEYIYNKLDIEECHDLKCKKAISTLIVIWKYLL